LPNSVGVPTDITFRITFDDYPDPDTVRSDSLLLTTGYFWVPGTYGVDLIGKAAVVRPINSLAPRLGYGLHLRPALASLAGCPGHDRELSFVTGDGPIGHLRPNAAARVVQAILDAKCGGGCHLGGDDSGTGCVAAGGGGAVAVRGRRLGRPVRPPRGRTTAAGWSNRAIRAQLPAAKLLPATPADRSRRLGHASPRDLCPSSSA
jgi:hypothetical protein